MSLTLRTIAIHEAGHALAALYLGCNVRRLSIIRGVLDDGTEYGGLCEHDLPFMPEDGDTLTPLNAWLAEQRMIIHYGGIAAQAVMQHRGLVPLMLSTGRHDHEAAMRIGDLFDASGVGAEHASALVDLALCRAMQIARSPSGRKFIEDMSFLLIHKLEVPPHDCRSMFEVGFRCEPITRDAWRKMWPNIGSGALKAFRPVTIPSTEAGLRAAA